MAALSTMGAMYTSSPQQVSRTSPSPDPTNVEHQLVAGMSALRSHDSESENAYPSHWSGCLGSQTSSDEFENYALHSSPAASNIAQASSSQTPPRSWNSPTQLGPTPWEAATEQLHSRYQELDPQLTGYLSGHHHGSIPTSFPVDGLPFIPTQSCDGSEDGYQRARSQTEPYPAGYRTSPTDGYASTPESSHPLSPCSTTLTLPMDESAGEDVSCQASTLFDHTSDSRFASKKLPAGAVLQTENKAEEPYAKLIYRAFLSTPRRALTLQEIYQWFRENTDKGKDDTKGWQNSIRHNLSMNQAFTKRERRPSNAKASDGESTATTTTASQTDSKKSTEWYLEPWAVAGVQSTTRYRKGNQSRRSAASHHGGLTARGVYRSYPAHHHHSLTSGGGSGSRKGRARSSLRGSRQHSLRVTAAQLGSAAYHFPTHHDAATRSPFTSIHHLINDPYQPHPQPFYNTTPPAHSHAHSHSHTHSHSMDIDPSTPAPPTTTIDYAYPDPQLFPPSNTTSTAPTMARASSEPGVGIGGGGVDNNEPVTPEPLASLPSYGGGGDHHHGHGFLMAGGYHHHHHQAASGGFGGFVPVPGVFEDVVEGYHVVGGGGGGAGMHGWGAEVGGGAAGAGGGVCGEEGVYHGQGQGY